MHGLGLMGSQAARHAPFGSVVTRLLSIQLHASLYLSTGLGNELREASAHVPLYPRFRITQAYFRRAG